MKQLPQKQSLVTQTVAVLKDEIRSGAWPRTLPAERKLCEQLVVGRSTLRAALACLSREGLIEARRGIGWEILRPKPVRSPAAQKTLVLLVPQPLHMLQPFEMFWIDKLRECLGEAGYHLDVRHEQACYTARPERALEDLARRIRPAAWVLNSSPAPLQRWFSQRGLPCVIVGGRHPGVALPNVDRDFPAACHHAAGQLIAKGHTRLALIQRRSGFASGPHCIKSFLDAAARFGVGGEQVRIVYHDGTRDDLSRQLGALLRQRPAVTGFMVTSPIYALATLGILLGKGLRLPEDAALISRSDAPVLEYMVPSVAHYLTDPTLFARKVSRTVLKLVHGEESPPDVCVIPHFVPGETFG